MPWPPSLVQRPDGVAAGRILMLHRLALLFPVWMILSGAAALYWPKGFMAMNQGPVVVLVLAFIMLCMGLTLTLEDFRRVARMPRAVAVGFTAQYSIMPLLGWGVAQALNLPPHFAVGLILVGCCPGGTASNLVSLHCRRGRRAFGGNDGLLHNGGDHFDTIADPVPCRDHGPGGYLAAVQANSPSCDYPRRAWRIAQSLGAQLVARVMPVAPLLSVAGVCFICAVVFAANAEAILDYGFRIDSGDCAAAWRGIPDRL